MDLLGLNMNYKEWDRISELPYYIRNSFIVYRANVSDVDCIMIEPVNKLPTIPSIKKQIETIQKIENKPVFLKLENISRFRKANLLKNQIAFIIEGKDVFYHLWQRI